MAWAWRHDMEWYLCGCCELCGMDWRGAAIGHWRVTRQDCPGRLVLARPCLSYLGLACPALSCIGLNYPALSCSALHCPVCLRLALTTAGPTDRAAQTDATLSRHPISKIHTVYISCCTQTSQPCPPAPAEVGETSGDRPRLTEKRAAKRDKISRRAFRPKGETP